MVQYYGGQRGSRNTKTEAQLQKTNVFLSFNLLLLHVLISKSTHYYLLTVCWRTPPRQRLTFWVSSVCWFLTCYFFQLNKESQTSGLQTGTGRILVPKAAPLCNKWTGTGHRPVLDTVPDVNQYWTKATGPCDLWPELQWKQDADIFRLQSPVVALSNCNIYFKFRLECWFESMCQTWALRTCEWSLRLPLLQMGLAVVMFEGSLGFPEADFRVHSFTLVTLQSLKLVQFAVIDFVLLFVK